MAKKEYELLLEVSNRLVAVETDAKNTARRLDEFTGVMVRLDETTRTFPKFQSELEQALKETKENRKEIEDLRSCDTQIKDRITELESSWSSMEKTFFKPLSRIFWYIVYGIIGVGLVTAITFGLQNLHL